MTTTTTSTMSATQPLSPSLEYQKHTTVPPAGSVYPGQSIHLTTQSLTPNSLLTTSTPSPSMHTVGAPSGSLSRRRGESSILTQEVHIIQVAGDTVDLDPGVAPDKVFHNFGKSLAQVLPSSHSDEVSNNSYSNVGPPPPSPPPSVDRDEKEDDVQRPVPPKLGASRSYSGSRPSVTESPPRERRLRSFVSGSGPSTEPSAASHLPKSLLNSANPPTPNRYSETSASGSRQSKVAGHLSADGHLQPPPVVPRRPTRRNTTGSSPRTVKAVPMHRHDYGYSQPFAYDEGDGQDELANDIQLHAELIRRERMSKRAKAQQEAEAALTAVPGRSQPAGKEEAQNVFVGNLIGEDHVNYVLMYNMLTGIRIGVSRCQAKIKRPLTDEDFTARHKFSFDIVGNELTPSAKYDFKFKDYAPWVFRELREDYFHLDPADYLLSLTAQYILSELGSPGKSGSFFYFSRDYRFIIKTIRHSEHKFLRSVLKNYYMHVKSNPHTLLSRFYGLHRVKLPHGRKIHFVIMNNLFPPHRDIHETYDLKGSTVGREYPEDKAAANPRAGLKDLNWINREKMLELGPEKRALLTEQLRRDTELLQSIHVMDYSLLVGIHNMQRGNRDNVRRNTLKVFSPDIAPMRRKPTLLKGGTSPEAIAMRRAMRESDPKRLGKGTIRLPESDTGDRLNFLFYQDEMGLRATDEANDPMDTIYYLGIIDILTPYTVTKKLEHIWKGLKSDRHKISPVPPSEYADRFFSFMKAIMRGGGGGARFKPE